MAKYLCPSLKTATLVEGAEAFRKLKRWGPLGPVRLSLGAVLVVSLAASRTFRKELQHDAALNWHCILSRAHYTEYCDEKQGKESFGPPTLEAASKDLEALPAAEKRLNKYLHRAIERNSWLRVRLLLNLGAPLNMSYKGKRPLEYASAEIKSLLNEVREERFGAGRTVCGSNEMQGGQMSDARLRYLLRMEELELY